MEANYDLIQLRRQWFLEDLNSSPPSSPMHSPPRSLIEMDDDHWISPLPTSNQESRGPELHRIFENFAETDAKISKALFEAEQKNWDAICKRRLKVQNEIMLTREKNELDLKALPLIARSESAGAPLMPFHKSMLDVDNTKEELEHSKDRDAPKEESRDKREDRLKGKKIREERLLEREREMERRLEAEDAVVGKKRKITTHRHRDISEIVAEVMEAKKAMENAESCGCNMSLVLAHQ